MVLFDIYQHPCQQCNRWPGHHRVPGRRPGALVFNFSHDVWEVPPPEKPHHTGHRCQYKPQLLAVSCCTNNAVSRFAFQRADVSEHVWLRMIGCLMVWGRRKPQTLSLPIVPCKPCPGRQLIGFHAPEAWGDNKGWPRWRTAPPRSCGSRQGGNAASAPLDNAWKKTGPDPWENSADNPRVVWETLDPHRRPSSAGEPAAQDV